MNKSLTLLRLLLKGTIMIVSIPYYILYLIISWVITGTPDYDYVKNLYKDFLFEIKDVLGIK